VTSRFDSVGPEVDVDVRAQAVVPLCPTLKYSTIHLQYKINALVICRTVQRINSGFRYSPDDIRMWLGARFSIHASVYLQHTLTPPKPVLLTGTA